jgi:hypothetical protein
MVVAIILVFQETTGQFSKKIILEVSKYICNYICGCMVISGVAM